MALFGSDGGVLVFGSAAVRFQALLGMIMFVVRIPLVCRLSLLYAMRPTQLNGVWVPLSFSFVFAAQVCDQCGAVSPRVRDFARAHRGLCGAKVIGLPTEEQVRVE